MFLSGFSSVSRAYASSDDVDSPFTDDNVYYRQETYLRYYTSNWTKVYQDYTDGWDELLGYNIFKSESTDGVYAISLYNSDTPNDMIYIPQAYDYYVYATVYAKCNDDAFSFAPNQAFFDSRACNGDSEFILEDFKYYHHDGYFGTLHTGFSISGKLPSLNNTNLEAFYLTDSDLGSLPSGELRARVLIYQVPKGSDGFYENMIEILEDINQSVNTQGQSISSAIDSAADQIQKVIEDQYSMDHNEDFGVSGIVDQVNDKMGVLSFGSDTLVNFLDLFDPANATNTTLTFPAFKMTIQGEEYSIWSNINYNLESLEESFGVLVTAVRWATVAMVWIALLNYLVKAFDHIINKGAR